MGPAILGAKPRKILEMAIRAGTLCKHTRIPPYVVVGWPRLANPAVVENNGG